MEVNDNLLVVETGKVALDISSPYAGRIQEIFVELGEDLAERMPLLTVCSDAIFV